jgi:hypothetical protein
MGQNGIQFKWHSIYFSHHCPSDSGRILCFSRGACSFGDFSKNMWVVKNICFLQSNYNFLNRLIINNEIRIDILRCSSYLHWFLNIFIVTPPEYIRWQQKAQAVWTNVKYSHRILVARWPSYRREKDIYIYIYRILFCLVRSRKYWISMPPYSKDVNMLV